MDIDIGNLVYIVFVAVIIIVNLFTKKKKQPPRQGPQNQNPDTVGPVPVDSRKSFEELLEEFTNPQKAAPAPVPTPKPTPAPKPIPAAAPKAQPIYQSTTRVEAERKREQRTHVKKSKHSVMQTEYGRFDEFKKTGHKPSQYAKAFRHRDAARQAFVFSEIFKKKF